ncbi:hypothetical protein OUZ56_005992 [Daphnia magna]|uniref:Uncharacterized protein n=1 Tax=Daphnia magna TaxID=35525 RepID=A0ABQ9YUC2_9CRUS|nr:hypothetical protein OUZ56_005992 [Daphnia magna]
MKDGRIHPSDRDQVAFDFSYGLTPPLHAINIILFWPQTVYDGTVSKQRHFVHQTHTEVGELRRRIC